MTILSQKMIPRSVLVTGSSGQLGSRIIEHLSTKYPDTSFICLDLCAHTNTNTKNNIKYVKGDLCTQELLIYLLQNEGIDMVIHCATQKFPEFSLDLTRNNVMATHVLLEAIRHVGEQVKRVIHITTDQTPESSVYAATKAASDLLISAYRAIPSVIVKYKEAENESKDTNDNTFLEKIVLQLAD